MHYSRIAPVASGRRYLPSTAVLLVEIIKLAVSLSITTYQTAKANPSSSPFELFVLLYRSFFSPDSWKLIIPAALYTLQNSLVYMAISNLEAVTFQVTYQLKILTTVLFSIALLGKTISSRQWLALVLLTLGVAIVQTSGPHFIVITSFDDMKSMIMNLLQPITADLSLTSKISLLQSDALTSQSRMAKSTPDFSAPTMNASKGILAVMAASTISGLTCVYFEKVVKETLGSVSLWTRNVQLSFFSLFPALAIGVLWQDGQKISENGFFVGYSSIVWITIALQALGGIIVAVCITYTDNLAKNFAASISIVFSCVASALLFGTPLTLHVSLSCYVF
jgi:solute carrier family 35 (UDP-sugar transporter), member A1/2/3